MICLHAHGYHVRKTIEKARYHISDPGEASVILVVDDSPLVLLALDRLFDGQTLPAPSLASALAIARQSDLIRAVVMDAGGAGQRSSGIHAIRSMRRASMAPVIIWSDEYDEDDARGAKERGCFAYVDRADVPGLVKCVRAALKEDGRRSINVRPRRTRRGQNRRLL